MIPTVRASELRVGQQVPVMERQLDLVRMIAYAGATWDWHRLHYDTAYAQSRHLAGPVVDGQMLGALLAEALLDWLGPRAFIRKLAFRLRAMVFAGEIVRCEGEVIAGCDEHPLVTIAQRIWVGERLAAEGSALVELPA